MRTRMSRMSHTNTKGGGGYTLVEFAITLLILGIFLAFATPFMFSQLRQAKRAEDRVDVQQSARGALRTMIREIRQAEVLYKAADRPSGKNALSFGVDLNGDTVLDDTTERITYYLKDGILFRGPRFNQGQPIAEDVSVLRFTMFGSNLAYDTNDDGLITEDELTANNDENGNPIWTEAELLNVTRVRVSLTLATGETEQTYSADAWLRNKVAG